MFSFSSRKPSIDLCPYVRRICDLTTPNLPNVASVARSENRSNRAIPTLICPWENSKPVVDECSTCLTTDLSDRGARLVLPQPVHVEQVLLGYWIDEADMPDPWFFLGEVRRCQAAGGGFWNLGVELIELANNQYRDDLSPLREHAARLLPPVLQS
jgi:hypothetical protein